MYMITYSAYHKLLGLYRKVQKGFKISPNVSTQRKWLLLSLVHSLPLVSLCLHAHIAHICDSTPTESVIAIRTDQCALLSSVTWIPFSKST